MTESNTAVNSPKSFEETQQILLRLMWSDVGCNGGNIVRHGDTWIIQAWFEDAASMKAFSDEIEGVRLEKEVVGRIEAQ